MSSHHRYAPLRHIHPAQAGPKTASSLLNRHRGGAGFNDSAGNNGYSDGCIDPENAELLKGGLVSKGGRPSR
ncbi:MAG: hypothetical protein VB858_14835, partial [Planctomycetaceae bacterium]